MPDEQRDVSATPWTSNDDCPVVNRRHRRWQHVGVVLAALAVAGPTAGALAQGRVYVASGATMLAFDTATNAFATSYSLVSAPTRIVASADGAYVFATHAASGAVSIIDTTTQIVTTMTAGASASALAVSPDGRTLYVSTAGSLGAVVQVIDVATRNVVGGIPTPASGSGGDLAITADGSRLFFASGAVSVIDTTTRTVVRAFGTGTFQVEVSPDGSKAFVSATTGLADGALLLYDMTGVEPVLAGGFSAVVGDLAMTPDGSRVYAVHEGELVFIYGVGAFFPGRTVIVVDGATGAAMGSIDLGASSSNWSDQNTGRAVIVSRDRRHVYVSVPRLAAVAVADVNTNRVTSLTSVFSPGVLGAGGPGPVLPYVVDAVSDSGTYSNFGGVAVANVLANDTIGGLRATLAQVTLAQVSSDAGLRLDAATGAVSVEPGASAGVKTVVYEICERDASANCDRATVTITVRDNYPIDAAEDAVTTLPARLALASVLANDTLNGLSATTALVTLTQMSSTATSISLVPSTGGVFVYAGTPAGVHTLTYRICEKATPGNCDQATVTITVQAFTIDAVDDAGSVTRSGGTALANVLANDRFNGAVATTTSVTLTQVTPQIAGVTLNPTTGAVSVANGTAKGTYSIGYAICEKASPANCDSATVTVTVTAYTITAAADSGRGSSKYANTPIASVLANDRLGGAQATTANVILSFVSMTPSNPMIRLDPTDGSVDVLGRTNSVTHWLVYRICERADPTNCAQGTATIALSGK